MKLTHFGNLEQHLTAPRVSWALGRLCRAWLPRLAGLLLAVAVLDTLLFNVYEPAEYGIDVGGRGDENMVRDAWDQELSETGSTYRWTRPRSAIDVQGAVILPGAGLQLEIGAVPSAQPKPVVFELGGDAQLSVVQGEQARAYHVLPAQPLRRSSVAVVLATEGRQVGDDPRELGVRLDDAAVERWDGIRLPALWPVLAQCAIVASLTLTAARLQLPRALIWATGLAALALSLWMPALDPLVAGPWLGRVAAAALLVLLFAVAGTPLLDRIAPELGAPRTRRWLYALTALAVFIRLAGVAYPRFGSHDLYIHSDRLADVQIGSLYLWDTPSEFGGRRSVVPSAYYVLTSPLGLLLNTDLALQWLAAAVDGAVGLLVALLARRLGASERAALLAALLVAVLPIQLTALWWGFAPQMLGQWLLVLVAVLAADPRPPAGGRFQLAALVLTLALLTHPGVVTLGGVWLAVLIAIAFVRRKQYAAGWAGILALAATVAVALLYAEPLLAQLRSLGTPATGNPGMDEPTRLRLLWEALASSFRPLGRAGALASLLALVWWTRGQARALALAWIASAALFLLVDVVSGLQVRYSYFVLPMVAVGAGLLLDRLMRTRPGALVGWTALAAVAALGLLLWYQGVVDLVKPTLTALTH